jgi:hypothetical protein
VITYAGLARLISAATGEVSKALPPGNVTMRVLGRVMSELRTLREEEQGEVLPGTDLHRATGLSGRALWQHNCGGVRVGNGNAEIPPHYCEVCAGPGQWAPMYVRRTEGAPVR